MTKDEITWRHRMIMHEPLWMIRRGERESIPSQNCIYQIVRLSGYDHALVLIFCWPIFVYQ